MNLPAMLERCRRDQWKISDLDWSGKPRPMSRDDEVAVVQYFTDMAGIERLAKALFAEQAARARDPVLREIFLSFVEDEERHAVCAERLARHYDVHRYETYEINRALQRFAPHFVRLVQRVSADIGNQYVTGGELFLDIALLRSIDDYVDDDMSHAAMDRINRDESRHIAIDFYMIEYYASAAYAAVLEKEPKPPLRDTLRASWALAHVLFYAAPFLRGVFLIPMQVVDPNGKRLREAFKRMQLVSQKKGEREGTFSKVMNGLQALYNESTLFRKVLGPVAARVVGIPPEFMNRLYTEAEARRAATMSFEELAREALAVKSRAA